MLFGDIFCLALANVFVNRFKRGFGGAAASRVLHFWFVFVNLMERLVFLIIFNEIAFFVIAIYHFAISVDVIGFEMLLKFGLRFEDFELVDVKIEVVGSENGLSRSHDLPERA